MWQSQSSRSSSDRGIWVPSANSLTPGLPVEGVEVDVDVDVGGVADAGVVVVVGEEELGQGHQGVGVFDRQRAGRGAVGVVGGGEAQGVFEGGPGDGVEFTVEDPGPGGEGADVEAVAGFGGFGFDQGVGVAAPAGHHRFDVADGELDQGGDQFRFVLGEQCDGGRGELGDDGVDLPAGQLAGAVGGGGDRELAEGAGVAHEAGGVARGTPGESDEPCFHRAGPVERP